MRITRAAMKELWKQAAERLQLACDEAHSHSVRKNCFIAKDEKDLTICSLCEYADGLLTKMDKAGKILKEN